MIGLALLLGLTTAFAIPAMQALVPLLVPREELGPAVALSSLTFNLARAIGPVAGAFVVATLGITGRVCPQFRVVPGPDSRVDARASRPVRRRRPAERPQLRESMRLVGQDAMLAILLMTVAAISLSADPVNTLTPGFAKEIFHRSDSYTGYLVGRLWYRGRASRRSPWPAGPAQPDRATAGHLCRNARRRDGRHSAWRQTSGGPTSRSPSPASASCSPTPRRRPRCQLEVADNQRGRVMALWSLAFLGTRPFGSLADGALAQVAGLRVAAVVMAGIGAGRRGIDRLVAAEEV